MDETGNILRWPGQSPDINLTDSLESNFNLTEVLYRHRTKKHNDIWMNLNLRE